MRTRRRIYSSNVYQTVNRETKRKRVFAQDHTYQKLLKIGEDGGGLDFFDRLPDDLVVSILCKLSASAGSPSDFVSVILTCKRMNGLGVHSLVLSKASTRCLAVKAKNWSSSSHRFLKRCADAGNAEALYTLGMTLFYCLQQRGSGISLMAKAAIASHAQALYSLAVIKFNGSGGTKSDKDLHAGVALCARAAFLGHIDALRELGHCLQDGYGVRQNIAEGRRFLIEANFREIASVLRRRRYHHHLRHFVTCKHHHHLLSDFGYNVPIVEAHPVSKFLSDWFLLRSNGNDDLRLCSHSGCGRPETRRHEFRRCSVCGIVNYCSRACQALDWKLRHKAGCTSPFHRWIDENEEVILMEVQERVDR